MKTHQKILEEAETRLFTAMIDYDMPSLIQMLDPELSFTNETGKIFKGTQNLPILDKKLLRLDSIIIIERSFSFFNNVAIVNSFEKRSGAYINIQFDGESRHVRVWKFNGRKWIMIGVMSAIL